MNNMFRRKADATPDSAATSTTTGATRKQSWFSRSSFADTEGDSAVTPRKSSWFGGDSGPSRRLSVGTELSTRLDVDAQLMGDLWKKDTAGTSRWAERFFVLKDGFLLYYDKWVMRRWIAFRCSWISDSATPYAGSVRDQSGAMTCTQKVRELIGCSLSHLAASPHTAIAGALPLDGVEIEAVSAGPNKTTQSAFRIAHPSFGARTLTLCAQGPAERDKWMHALEVCVWVCMHSL